jgi:phosphohistidine phosphatase
MRHGEALSATENAERPLSTKGQQDAKAIGQYLAACQISIPHIIHSAKLRAKETAQYLASSMPKARLVEAKTGLDETDNLDYILEELPNWHEDTLIVGHLPFLSQLVSHLVAHESHSPIVRFAPATIVCLDLHEAQRWIVNWMMSPVLLKAELASSHIKDLF